MARWKAPANAGPSVSVGGATFNVVDSVVELPDEGDYTTALVPFGYEPIPTSDEERAAEAAQRLAAAEDERIAAEEAAAKEAAELQAAEEAAAKEAAELQAAEEAAAKEASDAAAKSAKKK
jgi:hypothetical protein